jgi:hypothetical protein
MRSALGLAASALAGLAAIVSSQDGSTDLVPFYVGLTFLGGLEAWAAGHPLEGARRSVAAGAALLWAFAAAWVAVLLIASVTIMQASGPSPQPESTYLGLTGTVYRLVGLFGGVMLVLVSAFGPERLLQRMAGTVRQTG